MPGVVAKQKQSKNQFRRAAKKAKKEEDDGPTESKFQSQPVTSDIPTGDNAKEDPSPTEADPLDAFVDVDESDPLAAQFKDVFGKFIDPAEDEAAKEAAKPQVFFDDDNDVIPEEDEHVEEDAQMSKKQRKAQSKLSIAELKALVKRPELVEWTDTSSQDPRLLIAIKASRNVVPVPSHWSLKREYLSSKRGVEKPAFALPKFIQETGIQEMRDAALEKQNEASLKQKQRERVQPKMGKLDIDYQRLYEAFFRFQTKPVLTRYGEVYYEGKEYETNMKHLRPGELTEELREALNMAPGNPPPWLLNQQRFGPPPSYPSLRIPGLTAPIPIGADWGYQPGGYGKPPVSEDGKPLFGGNVFGEPDPDPSQHSGDPVDKALWGELQAPEESEEEDEDEDEDDDEDDEDEDGMATGMRTQNTHRTAAGTSSVAPSEYGGSESDAFTLKKQKRGVETEDDLHPRTAGQVIPEQERQASGFFGSDRGYDLRNAQSNTNVPMLDQGERGRKRKVGDVDVSVDVDALVQEGKLSKDEMQRRYEAQRRQDANPWGGGADQDDLSQMIAEENNKRLKKDEDRRGKR